MEPGIEECSGSQIQTLVQLVQLTNISRATIVAAGLQLGATEKQFRLWKGSTLSPFDRKLCQLFAPWPESQVRDKAVADT